MNLIRRASVLSALFLLLAVPAQAEEKYQLTDVSEPTDVGTTTMPAGQYAITEQVSGKSYNLTVTSKGLMILAPSHKAATTTAPAANSGTTTTTSVTTAASSLFGGAPAATAGAAADAGMQPGAKHNSPLNGLMQKGLEQGVQELMKSGATKQLNKYIK